MITDLQRIWLESLQKGLETKYDNPKKYSQNMIRIQKHIDKMLENLIWLAKNFPEILKNEEKELANSTMERHARVKSFLFVSTLINPLTEDPTLIKLMTQLTPPNMQITLEKKGRLL